jgi:thiosulfate dehydrogenase
MPLMGVWGQFPQYRAREGAVDTLEDRINGCMERSMNGRALPLESREMRAFSAYMRWLSTGVPDGAKLKGAGTLKIKEPARAANLGRGAEIFSQICAGCHGAAGLGQRAQTGAGYQFPPLCPRSGVPTATTTAPE